MTRRRCVRVIDRHLASYGWALLQLGSAAQAHTLARSLDTPTAADLEVVEIRAYDRGVIVRLARPDA